jgi:prephenate dehydrogenase
MASVQITAGSERKFQVAGAKDDGTPEPLDQKVALVLATVSGDSAVRQSADGHDVVIIGAPTESAGQVSIEADNVSDKPLDLVVDVTGTHNSSNDATQIGITALGDEAPIGSLT